MGLAAASERRRARPTGRDFESSMMMAEERTVKKTHKTRSKE
jgi:hypothetical protein